MADKLIFVYNADSGLVNGVADYFHKMIRPATYACKLCAVTYGLAGMKGQWRVFLTELPLPAEFLHRDEFRLAYPGDPDAEFPSAFIIAGGSLLPFISRSEMEAVANLDKLIDLVTRRVEELAT
jgi:hypothetical protein